MQIDVSFRHMESSEALKDYATDKLSSLLDKFLGGQRVDASVVLSVERFRHVANLTININDLVVKAVEKTEDMYSSIDLALEKVERQLRRYKGRIRNHKSKSNRFKSFSMGVLAAPQASDFEEEAADYEEEYEEEVAAAEATEPTVELVRKENYPAPFMKPDDAVMMLDLRDWEFFVFTNEETERINIVYRREDGNFGLIETEPQHH